MTDEKTRAEARERARQAEVDRLAVDPFEDTAYDDITRLAADMAHTPVALITIIDGDRQWFKSRLGTQVSETPREISFCAHAIERPGDVMVVEDTTRDPRFAANPLVTGDPNIRFYAGAPLVTASGHAIGTVCVLDTQPRQLGPEQLEMLRFLAQQVMAKLETKT